MQQLSARWKDWSSRRRGVPPDSNTASQESAPSDLSPASRLTATPLGQWLISGLLVATLGAVVAWNMPPSAVRDAARPVLERFVNLTGLTQAWNVYAPDPAQITTEVVGRIDYADGSSSWWDPPRGDALFDQYRTYRWVPATIRLSYDSNQAFRKSFAEWLARSQDHKGRQPAQVELVRRWRDLTPPGEDSTDGTVWKQESLFTLDLTEEATP